MGLLIEEYGLFQSFHLRFVCVFERQVSDVVWEVNWRACFKTLYFKGGGDELLGRTWALSCSTS